MPEARARRRASPDGLGARRREARERALSLLYEAEAKDCEPGAVLQSLPVPPDPFAVDVVAGVAEHRAELDALITGHARGWTIERMPVLDRTLLRMALYELSHRPDVPTGVVISEAVELAQRYSTDDSGRFVNGMLGKIAPSLRPASGHEPGDTAHAAGEPAGTG
ncbi:MAG: transcription antitermination factor NusB [Actinobacteria bacterium]|nr:transcription antitermination factor NusB [Actinomycetota bacterium]